MHLFCRGLYTLPDWCHMLLYNRSHVFTHVCQEKSTWTLEERKAQDSERALAAKKTGCIVAASEKAMMTTCGVKLCINWKLLPAGTLSESKIMANNGSRGTNLITKRRLTVVLYLSPEQEPDSECYTPGNWKSIYMTWNYLTNYLSPVSCAKSCITRGSCGNN